MTRGAYQSDPSDSNAEAKPALSDGSSNVPVAGRRPTPTRCLTIPGGPFHGGQFSLFPENCRDWSIEMKWAGDITPRKNFGKDRWFCLEVKRVRPTGLLPSP